MHRVGAGDMFDNLEAGYATTADVLRSLNYSLTGPLKANTVILIAPGLHVVDPTLPSFRVREADSTAVSIDELARQYHVEAHLLGHYNGCADGCALSPGDWILIPVIQSSTAAP